MQKSCVYLQNTHTCVYIYIYIYMYYIYIYNIYIYCISKSIFMCAAFRAVLVAKHSGATFEPRRPRVQNQTLTRRNVPATTTFPVLRSHPAATLSPKSRPSQLTALQTLLLMSMLPRLCRLVFLPNARRVRHCKKPYGTSIRSGCSGILAKWKRCCHMFSVCRSRHIAHHHIRPLSVDRP